MDHKTHDYIFLDSHAAEKRGEIAAMVDEVRGRSAAVVAAAAAVGEMKARVAARETTATAEVRRMFQAIRDGLGQRSGSASRYVDCGARARRAGNHRRGCGGGTRAESTSGSPNRALLRCPHNPAHFSLCTTVP